MGIDYRTARILCSLKRQKFCFGDVATLGRHELFHLTPALLIKASTWDSKPTMSNEEAEEICGTDRYAEKFFIWLGAKSVESFDYSTYENATNIWDMNQSLPSEYRDRYDFVFDGGTLEHIFNFPFALREAMTMVRIGGHFMSATPANGYLGHGFYQIGPDAAEAAMSGANGYKLKFNIIAEDRANPKFYDIPVFNERGVRATTSLSWPSILFYLGERVANVPIHLAGNQSDYQVMWEGVTDWAEEPRESKSMPVPVFLRYRIAIKRYVNQLLTLLTRDSFLRRCGYQRNKEL